MRWMLIWILVSMPALDLNLVHPMTGPEYIEGAQRGGVLAVTPLGLAARADMPCRQWVVYRRKHLLVGTTRANPEGYRLGNELAATLVTELPSSRARLTRARTVGGWPT